MKYYVITICLLVFLNDFSEGENAESVAIRNQNKYREPGILINKILPQKVYVGSNMVPKVNPTQLNLRLDNGLNVPKIIIPIANQQKNTIPQNFLTFKDPKPSVIENSNHVLAKELNKLGTSPVFAQKNEKPKQHVSQAIDTDLKVLQLFEKVDQNDLADRNSKKETSNQPLQQKKPQEKNDITSHFDSSKNPKVTPKPSQEKMETENPSKILPIVTQKDIDLIPEKENKNIEMPKNKTQSKSVSDIKESTSGTQDLGKEKALSQSDTVLNNNAKETIPITIYKIDDTTNRYSKSPDIEQFYPSRADYSISQPTSNVVIKNQNFEELCERSQNNVNQYHPEYQPQYSYYELPTYEANDYCQSNGNNIPTYQDASYIPYDSKDRVWRNWKTTEISIFKYEPEVKTINEYDKHNGFNMPIRNGDIGYDYYKQNVPLYQSYLYPTYKHMK